MPKTLIRFFLSFSMSINPRLDLAFQRHLWPWSLPKYDLYLGLHLFNSFKTGSVTTLKYSVLHCFIVRCSLTVHRMQLLHYQWSWGHPYCTCRNNYRKILRLSRQACVWKFGVNTVDCSRILQSNRQLA